MQSERLPVLRIDEAGERLGVALVAFQRASHITKLDLINNRLIANPMEPRVAIGEFDEGRDEFVLYLSSQNPHVQRILLATTTLRVPEHKIRVISPDVGGGFGCKAMHYAEEVIVLWAARRCSGLQSKHAGLAFDGIPGSN